MNFITTRKDTPTRTHPLSPCWSRSELSRAFRIRFAFNPDRFLGDTLTSAQSSKLPNAMDRDHWAFGAGYEPKHFLLCLTAPTLLRCATAAVFVQASKSQNGCYGSRSHAYSGPIKSNPYLTSLSPWSNTVARLHVRPCRTASLSHQDTIGFKRYWKQRRKSR